MIVVAWNNGKHHKNGAGYGFKLNASDRDSAVDREWKTIIVQLPSGKRVEANIDKASFWSEKCREIINKEFGEWLIGNGFAPWPKGRPPRFQLSHVSGNKFKLSGT